MAEPFHCDVNSSLFMGYLGNCMLNAADFHSNERGIGVTYLNTIKKTWVISRLAIELNRMPKSYEDFYLETWTDRILRFFSSRNYAITDNDNNVYGYAKSIWAMINTETRQPVDLLQVRDSIITKYVEADYNCPIDKPSRVIMSDKAKYICTIDTHYSDLDLNGHVNSIRYIDHVLDLFNLDWHRSHTIKRFEIAYVVESHYGDKLNFYSEDIVPGETCIKITKTELNTGKDVEVCRCKLRYINN